MVEPDEDFDGNPSGYHAYCPALEQQGASTWGTTEAEALRNINSLIRMVVQSMLEHGERLPEEPSHQVEVTVPAKLSALVRDGFAYDRGDGSHQIYCHPDGRRVTVGFMGTAAFSGGRP